MPSAPAAYFALVNRELVVGLGLGYAVTLVFPLFTWPASSSIPMGFGMVNVVDSQSGTQVPIIAQFQYILAALIFSPLGDINALRALATSFAVIPIEEGSQRGAWLGRW